MSLDAGDRWRDLFDVTLTPSTRVCGELLAGASDFCLLMDENGLVSTALGFDAISTILRISLGRFDVSTLRFVFGKNSGGGSSAVTLLSRNFMERDFTLLSGNEKATPPAVNSTFALKKCGLLEKVGGQKNPNATLFSDLAKNISSFQNPPGTVGGEDRCILLGATSALRVRGTLPTPHTPATRAELTILQDLSTPMKFFLELSTNNTVMAHELVLLRAGASRKTAQRIKLPDYIVADFDVLTETKTTTIPPLFRRGLREEDTKPPLHHCFEKVLPWGNKLCVNVQLKDKLLAVSARIEREPWGGEFFPVFSTIQKNACLGRTYNSTVGEDLFAVRSWQEALWGRIMLMRVMLRAVQSFPYS